MITNERGPRPGGGLGPATNELAGADAQEKYSTDPLGPREAFLALFDGDLVGRRNPLAQFHHQAARNFDAKSASEIAVVARAAVRKRAANPSSAVCNESEAFRAGEHRQAGRFVHYIS
jgi:hypothetical protein